MSQYYSFHRQSTIDTTTTKFIRRKTYTSSSNTNCCCAFTPGSGFAFDVKTLLVQGVSATTAYFGLIAAFDSPKGNLYVDENLFEVKQSQIPNAGLGLYVTQNMEEGTVLGTYPGVIRPLEANLSKLKEYSQCEAYIWRFTDNLKVIDPTDSKGNIQNYCMGGSSSTPFSYFFMENILGSFNRGTPTLLARINEPPPVSSSIVTAGVNVRTEQNLDTREIAFILARDVYRDEELFMDYGTSYDRSSYTSD